MLILKLISQSKPISDHCTVFDAWIIVHMKCTSGQTGC